MYSTFFGLEIANKALRTHQTAINVTGHNISNAETVGYSRQYPNIEVSVPLRLQVYGRTMSLGTGSMVNTIFRIRSAFVDNQWRSEFSKHTYWENRWAAMSKLEGIVNEPAMYSINQDLNNFWTAWSQLAQNPQNSGARSVVQQRAETLILTFRHVDAQLTDLSQDLNNTIGVGVNSINKIAEQIKDLNIQIHRLEVVMDNPNDLKDQRDRLIDELSQLVPVKVVESQDPRFSDRQVGFFQVFIGDGTQALVDHSGVNKLNTSINVAGFTEIVWEGSGDPLVIRDGFGQLKSAIDMRDFDIPQFRQQLDDLVNAFALAVNAIHTQGQGTTALAPGTGIPFFVNGSGGTSQFKMSDLALNSAIQGTAGLGNIATGLIDPLVSIGDNAIALQIANLAHGWSSLVSLPGGMAPGVQESSSLMDYYRSCVSALGVKVQEAERMTKGQEILLNNATNQRERISGVSLDEEMTNLIRFQRSYNAAARIVTTVDSMLEAILGMGLTR